ncbi:hypothetical protein A7D00_5306 [Trichophyton violaceum]|uniref:Uncharacterized protein n=1 Tax=Trichophyton violaceum TaxID=34388 RepID=A0A178FCX1_TRIVO|nr:hypothetical protein A7D00_5306 [Trichophyton violaceum]
MVQFTSAIMAPATAAFLVSFLAPSVYASPIQIKDGVEHVISCLAEKGIASVITGAIVDAATPCIVDAIHAKRHDDCNGSPLRLPDLNRIMTENGGPKYAECMKESYPSFPDVDVVETQVIKDCIYLTQPNGKNLVARGKSYGYEASCTNYKDAKHIPRVFEEAGPFRAKTDPFCDKMRPAVIDKGEGEVYEVLGDTTFKYGDSGFARPLLKHDVKDALGLKTRLTLTDRGRDLIKDDAAYDELCRPAFMQFGTKGKGCTQELEYRKSVHEGGGEFPTTVAKTGNLKIFDGKEEIGTLFVDLEVINEWPGLTEDEEKEAEGKR